MEHRILDEKEKELMEQALVRRLQQTEEERAAMRADFEQRFPVLAAYIKQSETLHERMKIEVLQALGTANGGPTQDEFIWYCVDRACNSEQTE
jgi:hypothetical protein